MKKRIICWLLLLGLVTGVSAAGLKIELPRELETFRAGPGMGVANARCLSCHSSDYVTIQPPMPRAFWKASIVKMQQKYGAEIPEDDVEHLAAYLARTYGTEKITNAPIVTPITISSPGADGNKLVAKFNCISCHGMDRKIVGPSFKDISAKYRGAPDAQARMTRQILVGGGGNWGPVPMPPFPQIPAGDARIIIDWILERK